MTTPPTTLPEPKHETGDRLMSLEEVAEKLGGISTRSVRRLIARGELPEPVKVLASPRLYNSDVMTYLDLLRQKRNQNTRIKKEAL